MKTCKRCKRTLPLDNFGMYAQSKDGKRCYCKDCWRELVRIQHAKRKSKVDTVEKVKDMAKVYTRTDLAHFTPRQLMEELKSRGFKWDYMLEPQRKIYFDKI